jgi:hypothetical protein
MFACCTKKDTSLEVVLLDELTELSQRMRKIIKQLKFLKQSDPDRYNTRTRGYSAPPRLESPFDTLTLTLTVSDITTETDSLPEETTEV